MAKSTITRAGLILFFLSWTFLAAKAVSLEGNWVWSEHILPGDSSIQRLEFLDGHTVAGFSFLPDVFAKEGEALESEAYRYKLSGKTITFASKNGWLITGFGVMEAGRAAARRP